MQRLIFVSRIAYRVSREEKERKKRLEKQKR